MYFQKLKATAGIALFYLLSSVAVAYSQDETADYIRANYTKYETMIPMRDGVRLFTAIYTPNSRGQEFPILLNRTPYRVAPYGSDQYKTRLGPQDDYAGEGFIFVYQDVRGKGMSEGEFVNMRPHNPLKKAPADVDESSDTFDTVNWLLENLSGHNGKVGIWGISYPGFYTSAGIIDSHPAIKAASPQAPIADWFWDDMHHHGAFSLNLAFNFFSRFGLPRSEPTELQAPRFDHGTPDGYLFYLNMGPLSRANTLYLKNGVPFWNQMAAHPNYDEFWQARNILPHLKNITCAVMTVGGLFDTEDLYGPFNTYRAIEESNPNVFNVLVMGPWGHGGWSRTEGDFLGDTHFGFKTSHYYLNQVELPFFRHYLKDGPAPDLPEALIFETGANRWRSFEKWPPATTQASLYFHAEGGLSRKAPEATGDHHDAYPSDPAKPVPYTTEITTRWTKEFMVEDQRFAARRPDVLVYRTEILKEDLTVAGPVIANLWVSTTGTDSDWVVKLIDVYPDDAPDQTTPAGVANLGGTQRLVRWEVMRGRFRESYEKPKPFVPNEVTQVNLPLQDVLHRFRKGHRIMVQIQSTIFPFIDRNPQKYVPNIFEAAPEDFIKVTNRVYRSKEQPSHLEVGILESGLP